ncbi:hypothetical protein PF005_g23502 [Phytophthora fragariae]|uniref:Uncharacterized protein n=1 Tax=Phytophthora fragariae TaxID=53985 RepID=A0A6A3I1B1_9STRA|nr:hypothetical protein PF003_g8763 [Phytophthora fragariae]KAE8935707.1 hypothetical protein PF009_g14357 [Phytophthora fragariae]KAE8975182.1 hypothetical protein PF011_g24581 [Phytophthora fragariae]KAE9081700.1 hypothetical protein PF007_g22558 [Phytophthora fragariae]KAE9090681.1 hypothetical protein PF006_g25097 [Phytophthora fragariae]
MPERVNQHHQEELSKFLKFFRSLLQLFLRLGVAPICAAPLESPFIHSDTLNCSTRSSSSLSSIMAMSRPSARSYPYTCKLSSCWSQVNAIPDLEDNSSIGTLTAKHSEA